MEIDDQKEICKKCGAEYLESPEYLKIGVSLNVKSGIMPIDGIRHNPEGDTTVWYVWADEAFNVDSDFFKPVHVSHKRDWCPLIIKYLGLIQGWRFLITNDGYEVVWRKK